MHTCTLVHTSHALLDLSPSLSHAGKFEDFKELGDLLEDGMPTPEQRLTREKLHDDLLGLLGELSGREARVIRLRFGLDDDNPQTLAEIGKCLDLSRERVRQIESRALHKLRLPERRGRVKDYLEDLD